MQYLTTQSSMELAHSMDVQSGASLYKVFEGFRHRGIAIDASLRSALDGFKPAMRDQILTKLLKEADNHHTVMAAFTQEDIHIAKFAHNPDRRLMLWQDITDNRDNLYSAANAAQQLLSNLGYNRYDPGIMTKVYSETSQQKISFVNFLKSKFSFGFSGKGAGASVSTGSSRTETREASQGRQLTYTENQQEHTGGWEFAMPYFREFGKSLDLIPPQALLNMSSDRAIRDGIRSNTIDGTYQRLRGTEVILLKAIGAALPPALKDDKDLKYLLNSGYVDGALHQLLDHEPYVTDMNETKYEKNENAELTWVIHAVLYAALYRGARQRIEDEVLRNTANRIHEEIPDFKDRELNQRICRGYRDPVPTKGSGFMLQSGTSSYHDQLQNVASHTSHLRLPVHIMDDGKTLTITGFSEFNVNGQQVTDPDMTLIRKSEGEVSAAKNVLPTDACMLTLPQTVDDLCRDYEKKIDENIQQSFSAVTGKTDASRITAKLKA